MSVKQFNSFCDGQIPYFFESQWSPMEGVKSPHKCPICEGKGELPAGFYNQMHTGTSISTQPERCRTCGGIGIVWR